jgi:Smg protein
MSLVERCGLTAEVVSSMLLILELEGYGGAVPGGLYCRLKPECRSPKRAMAHTLAGRRGFLSFQAEHWNERKRAGCADVPVSELHGRSMSDPDPDRESIQTELLAAGFPSREIQQAFEWLDSLIDRQAIAAAGQSQFLPHLRRPGAGQAGCGMPRFFTVLEQSGILSSETRELVIDRVMALEADDIGLHQLKWIILMVLFNQPGQEEAYAPAWKIWYSTKFPATFINKYPPYNNARHFYLA